MTKKILIVEDNYIALNIEKALMEKLDCIVDTAITGEIAVDLANNNKYDLILMDLGLPGIDGIEATKRIKDNAKKLHQPLAPIVAVTANKDPVQRTVCIKAGMDDVYGKPYTVEIAKKILSKFN